MARGRTRVCFFVGTHGDWGGASRIIFNLVRFMDRGRFDPLMMLSAEGAACGQLDAMGVPYAIWPHRRDANALSFARRLVRSLAFYRRHRIDLVSLAYGCIGWRPAELLAAKLMGIPVVQHCQRVVPQPSPFTKHSTLVLTCSDYIRRESGFDPERTRTLYDLVDIERFGNGTDIREALGIGRDRTVVAYLGRKRRAKGPDLFVNMARRLSDPGLAFLMATQRVGNRTPDAYGDEEFTRLIDSDPRITHVDFREDVQNLYATADVVVMPSREPEPSPAVVLECAASGTPIVATDTGATSELVLPEQTGLLVPVGDVAALVRGVSHLLEDPGRRAVLGSRAREWAKEKFFHAPRAQVEQSYAGLVRA